MEGGLRVQPSMVESTPSYLSRIIAETEDCFAQAQRAAKLRDWKAFNRLMDNHRNLCAQWEALVS